MKLRSRHLHRRKVDCNGFRCFIEWANSLSINEHPVMVKLFGKPINFTLTTIGALLLMVFVFKLIYPQ